MHAGSTNNFFFFYCFQTIVIDIRLRIVQLVYTIIDETRYLRSFNIFSIITCGVGASKI
jgi:hypothetical protein